MTVLALHRKIDKAIASKRPENAAVFREHPLPPRWREIGETRAQAAHRRAKIK